MVIQDRRPRTRVGAMPAMAGARTACASIICSEDSIPPKPRYLFPFRIRWVGLGRLVFGVNEYRYGEG
ncbi:hypothetical protein [Burkholderia sp. MSMB1826]|uniref:hypothetical protein n=1 Tax=Burkholderia sp. MSMB1826 TaxID=1637875 RepID=UPI000ADF4B5D|nr:hypothetical protein [Burkholderia sp. MSMB1826]